MRGLKLASITENSTRTGREMVLVIASDGEICDVLQAPHTAGQDTSIDLSESRIEALWSVNQVKKVKRIIKKTIRSRQVQVVDFQSESGDGHYESIFVPHGRDRVLMVVRDISAQKSRINKMQELAYVDEATKLPNREFLLDELRKCTEKTRLTEGRAAVLCFEIDQIDSHGNVFSSRELDALLKELAARFTHELRGANQPNEIDNERYSIVARIDFRRFGVVLPCIENGLDAEGVAERLSEAIRQPIKIGKRKISVLAKAGISLFPQDGTDAETLFENAVLAMEDASNSKDAQIKFHSGTVKLRALQRQDVEDELKAALDREEFDLNFLPIVDATTNAVVAIESLLRWPQTTLGSQSIQRVVSVAERTGLIVPIGNWVMRRSCEQLLIWRDIGHSELRIAVNLSAQEFSQVDLAERLFSILEDMSVDPSLVDLEINEYMLFRDAMKDYAMCTELKNAGFGVVVDDYGTGACSLAHLSRSPVDAIKIDNCFVSNSEFDRIDQATCGAITAMARELDLKVIAEGVETESQAATLREQGCQFLQGFYFCKPCSAEDMSKYLSSMSNQVGRT